MSLYPLLFIPAFKERVWGGRRLQALYAKPLPPGVPIGESWEIADRVGDDSVIANGPLAGRSVRWLMQQHGAAVLGSAAAVDGRFPLLCKILDARERLSLQVHPPAGVAGLGEPKTEMWYVAAAEPDSELFVGLRRGVTRDEFERRLSDGSVETCFHRIPVRAGDAMFLPSGRVHAIGAGLVIFEIQQNSDTTFRVFDWNRAGLDGQPRPLHLRESLASIDFGDVEPGLVPETYLRRGPFAVRPLVRDPLFEVDLVTADAAGTMKVGAPGACVLAAVAGELRVTGGGVKAALRPGDFCLLAAALAETSLDAGTGARFLVARAG